MNIVCIDSLTVVYDNIVDFIQSADFHMQRVGDTALTIFYATMSVPSFIHFSSQHLFKNMREEENL